MKEMDLACIKVSKLYITNNDSTIKEFKNKTHSNGVGSGKLGLTSEEHSIIHLQADPAAL